MARTSFFGWRAHSIFWYLLSFGLFFVPGASLHAASSETIYQSDFSSDPGWTTDQPDNFYWDPGRGALFARTLNQPTINSTASPSRYFYTITNLNPALSFSLSWDINILSVSGQSGGSGVAPFGLYGEKLYGFNQLNLNFSGNNQDGTFSTRFMQLEGNPGVIYTEANPGFNRDIGISNFTQFALGQWYTVTETYEASTRRYRFVIENRDTHETILQKELIADSSWPINPELRRLGISMHPEGLSGSDMGSIQSRLSGSTEYLIDNVMLTQINDETFDRPSSIFFLPGIQSSRLYKDTSIGTTDQLWEPNHNQDVQQLSMDDTGHSLESDIYTQDAMSSAYGLIPVYTSFFSYLASLKSSGAISDWETFAYDWRYDAENIVQNGVAYPTGNKLPTEELEALARKNNSKVTIVAHSNGGLVAKALVEQLRRDGKDWLVDKIVFVATPHLGAPKAIGALLHGYDQEKIHGLLIDDEVAREVIKNFPGVYGLLPTQKYFDMTGTSVVSFDTSTATASFRGAYGGTITDEPELAQFLIGNADARPASADTYQASKANSTMVHDAFDLHRNALDAWVAPAHIKAYEITGVGLNTVKEFHYQEFTRSDCLLGFVNCQQVTYYEPVPVFTRYGDATVVDTSAGAYPGAKTEYYIDLLEVSSNETVKDREHFDIAELPSTQSLIRSIVLSTTTPISFIHATKPNFSGSEDIVSVHSPVAIALTDSSGRRVGKTGEGEHTQFTADIPGSSYQEFGGSKYVIVPSSINYSVDISGQGEEGSYTLVIETKSGENPPVTLSRLDNATVTPDLSVTFSKAGGVFSDVTVDYNGDGTVDSTITLDGEKPTSMLFNDLRTLISSFSTLKQSERSWLLNNIDKAEDAGMRKGYGSQGVARIFGQMDGRLVTYVAGGLVVATDYSAFLKITNEIKTR